MLAKKKLHPILKSNLHPRNKHRERYDFKALIGSYPELSRMVKLNEYKDASIDFSNPEAVLLLNKALLKHFYKIEYWDIPRYYLCPPVPGRADYIHYMADLAASSNQGIIPTGNSFKCLDIGTGANCIYPIIGASEYGWTFVGSDIDPVAVKSATEIAEKNSNLKNLVKIRLQPNAKDIFKNIILENEHFDLVFCNPPFHSSQEEATSGTLRKLSNLKQRRITQPVLNFGGKNQELWCEGGEEKFVRSMITQSKQFANSCRWFSTLISKSSHLPAVYSALKNAGAVDIKTIPTSQGNKIGRIVAWSFTR